MSLNVKDYKVYYQTLKGDVKALDNVSFTVSDGEIMGVAGESGCGKSTLSNSLVLIKLPMKYVAGHVELDDKQLPVWDTEVMQSHRYNDVSIIPQYAMNAMNPTVRIKRLITDLLACHSVSYADILPELERRLYLVELDKKVLNLFPLELSGGMKQRMVMVLSTLLNPSLLIADEITSALDVSTQRAVAEMLVEFRDKSFVKSIIFVTHDISILYQVADTIMIMYAGKVVEKASTEVIMKTALHPYTRLLISSLPDIGIKYEVSRLKGIPGKPPILLAPPEGCRFRDRCPLAFNKCHEEPPLVQVGPGHEVACWKVVKDA